MVSMAKAGEFVLVDTWEDQEFIAGGMLFGSFIDKDGDYLAQFQKDPPLIANKNGFKQLRQRGQGPGDLESLFGACYRGDDLTIFEWSGKIKLFSKEQGTYEYKDSIFRKAEGSHFYSKGIAFAHDRWFLSGIGLDYAPEGDKSQIKVIFLKVYEANGLFFKDLLAEVTEYRGHESLRQYMAPYQDKLLFMRETELEVTVLDTIKVEVERVVALERPKFYKALPDDFYFTESKKSLTIEQMVNWQKGYSAVMNVAVSGKNLVVQVRTATPKLKRFAVLFYDLATFALKDTQFTDDLMLASQGDRFYFFKDGMPGFDDDAGPFKVEIREYREE